MKKIIFTLAFMSALHAETANTNFNVTTDLLASCSISASDMNFGEINASNNSNLSATSKITSICNKGVNYVLSSSRGSGVDYNNRSMVGATGNGDKLMYNLYMDPAMANIWGEATSVINKTANGSLEDTTIYGKIPANQYVRAGVYTDSITVTIKY